MTATKNSTHETYCVLDADHYGPCAPNEREYFVEDDERKVLWRRALPADEEARAEAGAAAVEAAFRFGHLPYCRNESRNIEAVEFPIEVAEETERGNLILALPMGRFRLQARRARKGELTSGVVVTSSAVGFGRGAADDTDSVPVRLYGRIGYHKDRLTGEVTCDAQVWKIEYADGTESGDMGVAVRDLERVS